MEYHPMEYNTSALCDIYAEQVDVVEPMLSQFGARASFAGWLTTIKCFEDNGLIRETLQQAGEGRVLLVDGGGSLRSALIDAQLADLATENGWEGLVIYGCVREVDELDQIDLGIHALGAMPIGAHDECIGSLDVPVSFGGVTFLPGDYLYADQTGIVISPEMLPLIDPIEEEAPQDDSEATAAEHSGAP